jgi:hypothetical protein
MAHASPLMAVSLVPFLKRDGDQGYETRNYSRSRRKQTNPPKNIITFCGKPMVSCVLKVARSFGIFD